MPTIQELLREHFEELAHGGRLSAPQLRAALALRACRTAALGGHVQRCPNGHVERAWYNSCRNRACPQCNGLAKERWLQRTRARLIDCAHWHVVFTIPHGLNALWRLNTAAMVDALFAADRDTLLRTALPTRAIWAHNRASSSPCTPGRARSTCIRTSTRWSATAECARGSG